MYLLGIGPLLAPGSTVHELMLGYSPHTLHLDVVLVFLDTKMLDDLVFLGEGEALVTLLAEGLGHQGGGENLIRAVELLVSLVLLLLV